MFVNYLLLKTSCGVWYY